MVYIGTEGAVMCRVVLIIAVLAIWLAGSLSAEAAPQLIRATGVYTMGDNDSPKIAKDAARQEAMRSAVEQAGVYIESYSEVHNMQLTADDVKMISGAVLKVIDEVATPMLNGSALTYTVQLTAEVDTDNIDMQAMMDKRTELEKLQQERDELKRRNEELLERYEHSSGEEKNRIGTRLENQYTLGQVFDECVAYIQRGDQHSAINTLTRVISDKSVMDSPLAYAYYLRGRAYYELNSDGYALDDFASAERTPHDNSIYPIWKVHQYRGMIYYDRRDYEGAYYELKLAWDASPHDDQELWDYMCRAEERLSRDQGGYPEGDYGDSGGSGSDGSINWERVIGDIVIGAIQGRNPFDYSAEAPAYKEPHQPRVYQGKPRPRVRV